MASKDKGKEAVVTAQSGVTDGVGDGVQLEGGTEEVLEPVVKAEEPVETETAQVEPEDATKEAAAEPTKDDSEEPEAKKEPEVVVPKVTLMTPKQVVLEKSEVEVIPRFSQNQVFFGMRSFDFVEGKPITVPAAFKKILAEGDMIR